jgi:hypothetical protein
MNNTIKFKIHGVGKLLTYEELIALDRRSRINKVRVIDIQTQKNWTTNFKTVMLKFR